MVIGLATFAECTAEIKSLDRSMSSVGFLSVQSGGMKIRKLLLKEKMASCYW